MQIFVINLESSKDRKNAMSEKIKRLAEGAAQNAVQNAAEGAKGGIFCEIFLDGQLLNSRNFGGKGGKDCADLGGADSHDKNGESCGEGGESICKSGVSGAESCDKFFGVGGESCGESFSKSSNENSEFFGESSSKNSKSSSESHPRESAPTPPKSPAKAQETPAKTPANALRFAFFPATNAANLAASPIKNYSPFLTKLVRGKELSAAEIACFSSHYRLWEHCACENEPIIVLEDDVSFEAHFLEAVAAIARSDFDYVRLMCLYDKQIRPLKTAAGGAGKAVDLGVTGGGNYILSNAKTAAFDFFLALGNVAGTQGYYLTPRAAAALLKGAKTWFHCVDNYLDMFFLHGVKNVLIQPFAIAEDRAFGAISTIKIGEVKKPRGIFKLTREVARVYFFALRRGWYLLTHKMP